MPTRQNSLICTPIASSRPFRLNRHIGGYLRARLLFQLDPSTPARPRPVACLFMIAKRSNVLSCRVQRVWLGMG
jgi:hypothetical protein